MGNIKTSFNPLSGFWEVSLNGQVISQSSSEESARKSEDFYNDHLGCKPYVSELRKSQISRDGSVREEGEPTPGELYLLELSGVVPASYFLLAYWSEGQFCTSNNFFINQSEVVKRWNLTKLLGVGGR